MWTALLSLLPGVFSTINSITNAITNEKIAALNATTDQERVAAQERVNSLQAQRDVLIADSQKSTLDIWLRSLIGLAPAVILWKLMVWDKVVGSFMHCNDDNSYACEIFNTDKLDPNMWWVIIAVTGFYFVTSIWKK